MGIVLATVCCRFGSWYFVINLNFCSDFEHLGQHFFFIFIAAPEEHTVVHFGEEIISIMSGTYYIDYSSSVLARTAQLLLTCSAALNVLSCSQRRRGWYESFFITEHRLVNINQPKVGIVRTDRTKTMSTWSWQKSPKHKMLGHWLTQNQPGKLPCRWLFWSGATFILRWSCWS